MQALALKLDDKDALKLKEQIGLTMQEQKEMDINVSNHQIKAPIPKKDKHCDLFVKEKEQILKYIKDKFAFSETLRSCLANKILQEYALENGLTTKLIK